MLLTKKKGELMKDIAEGWKGFGATSYGLRCNGLIITKWWLRGVSIGGFGEVHLRFFFLWWKEEKIVLRSVSR